MFKNQEGIFSSESPVEKKVKITLWPLGGRLNDPIIRAPLNSPDTIVANIGPFSSLFTAVFRSPLPHLRLDGAPGVHWSRNACEVFAHDRGDVPRGAAQRDRADLLRHEQLFSSC